MKLDQKQMHVVSQLFMAAGKAGLPFDLARFTRESSYASEILAKLSMAANGTSNDHLNALVLTVMDVMASVSAASVAAPTPSPGPASVAKLPTAQVTQREATDNTSAQYIGRLR
jgi:hypothetical protein